MSADGTDPMVPVLQALSGHSVQVRLRSGEQLIGQLGAVSAGSCELQTQAGVMTVRNSAVDVVVPVRTPPQPHAV
ncbi:hypothetical protein [Kineococcus indalonis]|uniref:hypothetical protein n=1 Tax=Kineococcus indalonis TaxID=2696566 RepID=UPI0014122921|nr:hypothetical protein [Kineococcus indalonis]NAZ86982.1 hypothetical protein [Kineococcus indalonis]